MSKYKLNLRQKKFADYYIELGNAEEAALKAGYSKAYARGSAHKLVANVGIKHYVEKRMEELKSQSIANQQEVLEYLTSVMRGEHTEETLKGIGEGAQTIADIEVSAKDRIKAAELIGKRHMMWTEKQEVKVTVPTIINNVPLED